MESIDDLQSELIRAHCVIFKSELPPINGQAVLYIDATPDKDYPLRILQAYRQDCNCQWAENTTGGEPTNPLLKVMNDQNNKRAKVLDKAIAKLLK